MNDGQLERVARVEDVPERGVLSVVLEAGNRVCLVRCDGEIFAINDNCTHEQFPMSEGYVLEGCIIECSWHGARFDLRSGAVLHPPAYSALPTYQVKVENGEIHVGPRKAT